MTTVHVCVSPVLGRRRRILQCGYCRTRRRILVRDYEWYMPLATCCTCGEQWSDGERLHRSASRGQQRKIAERAAAEWKAA